MPQSQWRAGRFLRVPAVLLVMAGLLIGPGVPAASAAACAGWTAVPVANPGTLSNSLMAVTVLSQDNAWAVGQSFSSSTGQTLIEHWNGSTWAAVPSPSPGTDTNYLLGVRAVTAGNIWAVGAFDNGGDRRTLIVHWNGHTWKQVPSPSPGTFNQLNALRVVSARDIWAVGFDNVPGRSRTLILRWNGHTWKQVRSPNPAEVNQLTGVAATGHTNAWAAGSAFNGHRDRSLILHWNGHTWKQVTTPNPGVTDSLSAVAALTTTDAWAVGFVLQSNGGVERTFILRWHGHRWQRVASPNAGGSASGNFLESVAITAARNAWAVGFRNTSGGARTVVLRWNGTRWRLVASPSPGTSDDLFGVASNGRSNAWAVGNSGASALAIHGCAG